MSRIGIVATHSFPIPYKTHTGDTVILDLAEALACLGHEVFLYSPDAPTVAFSHNRKMPLASYGKASPSPTSCEQACFEMYQRELRALDVVHDFSVTKWIAEALHREGRPTVSTLMGGGWLHPNPAVNVVAWSHAQCGRLRRGANDYDGTPTPDAGGPPGQPIKDAHVVNGGVDTAFYYPTFEKGSHVLWLNRWHPAKGYAQAIQLARETGVELVMAGEHPDNEMFAFQRKCVLDAMELAKGLPNVHFNFLPKDPDHHTAKRALYQRARALIYSVQFQEPFGLSQVEAMACGTPVIGTNFGSVAEVVDQGVGGVVVGNETRFFAQALELLPRLSYERVRDRAITHFDISVMARNYVKEYANATEGRGWGG